MANCLIFWRKTLHHKKIFAYKDDFSFRIESKGLNLKMKLVGEGGGGFEIDI